MTDRELLELAAKADGIGPVLCYESKRNCLRIGDRSSYHLWRPLTDDGDVFQLEVSLKLYVKHFPFLEDDATMYPGFVEVWNMDDSDPVFVTYLKNEGERLAASRRAIVRAAAEIGKEMS